MSAQESFPKIVKGNFFALNFDKLGLSESYKLSWRTYVPDETSSLLDHRFSYAKLLEATRQNAGIRKNERANL